MPYERLYANLNEKQLCRLLRDARRFQWQALDLQCCGLVALPDTNLWNLPDLKVLILGNYYVSFKRLFLGEPNTFSFLPDAMRKLTNLQVLSLTNTQLAEIPDFIENFGKLCSFSLRETPVANFPEVLCKLVELRSLYLGSTQISMIPESISKLVNLQSLNLSSTKITSLPDTLGGLCSLQSLSLKETQIVALPNAICDLENLEWLDLSVKLELFLIPLVSSPS